MSEEIVEENAKARENWDEIVRLSDIWMDASKKLYEEEMLKKFLGQPFADEEPLGLWPSGGLGREGAVSTGPK
jgi:hypothetical protein